MARRRTREPRVNLRAKSSEARQRRAPTLTGVPTVLPTAVSTTVVVRRILEAS